MKKIILPFLCVIPFIATAEDIDMPDVTKPEYSARTLIRPDTPTRMEATRPEITRYWYITAEIAFGGISAPLENTNDFGRTAWDQIERSVNARGMPFWSLYVGRRLNHWFGLFAGTTLQYSNHDDWIHDTYYAGPPVFNYDTWKWEGGWVTEKHNVSVSSRYMEFFSGARIGLGDISEYVPFSWFQLFGASTRAFTELGLSYNILNFEMSGDINIKQNLSGVGVYLGLGTEIILGNRVSLELRVRGTPSASSTPASISSGMGIKYNF